MLCAIPATAVLLSACALFGTKKQSAPPAPSAATARPAPSARPRAPATVARPDPASRLTVALLDPGNYMTGQRQRKDTLVRLAGNKALTRNNVEYYMEIQEAELRRRLTAGTDVTVEMQGESIAIGPVNNAFASDSAHLESATRAMLDTIAPVFNEYVKTLITVHSYSDSSGEAGYNQALSQRRALAVARYLIELGVAGKRIAVVGHGDTDPVASNATPKGRAQNRRIVIDLQPLVRQANNSDDARGQSGSVTVRSFHRRPVFHDPHSPGRPRTAWRHSGILELR